MTLRTIENFRLVDGEKLDGLPINTQNLIDTISPGTNISIERTGRTVKIFSLGGSGTPIQGGYAYNSFIAEEGQEVFNIEFQYEFNTNVLLVFKNGNKLQLGTDYIQQETSITLIIPATEDDLIEVIYAGKGEKGDKGDKGDNGVTPIKGVDYFDGIDGTKITAVNSSKVGKTTTLTVEGDFDNAPYQFDIEDGIDGEGSGDVVGPESSIDNNIAVFDGTTGKLIKDGGKTITYFESELSGKQDNLESGVNIKTINGQDITGPGVITLNKADIGLGNVDNTSDLNKPISTATETALNGKQNTITGAVSTGTTSNFTPDRIVITNGSGKIAATSGVTTLDLGNISGLTSNVQTQLNNKQETLINQTNIKSINGESILGSGDIEISPAVNIGDLDETTTITPTDEFIVNQDGNKKITTANLFNTQKEKFIAGEDLLKGDCIYIKNSDGKVYKTNKELTESTIGYLGFVNQDTLLDEEVIIDFDFTKSLESLNIGSKYYIAGSEGKIDNSSGTWVNFFRLIGPTVNTSINNEINQLSQSFIANSNVLKKVSFWLGAKTTFSWGDITSVKIGIANTVDGTPFAYSSSIGTPTTSNTFIKYTFNFDDVEINNGQTYWLRFDVIMSGIGAPGFSFKHSENNTYSNGILRTFRVATGVWTTQPGDLQFIINEGNFINSGTISTSGTTLVGKAYKEDLLLLTNNTQ